MDDDNSEEPTNLDEVTEAKSAQVDERIKQANSSDEASDKKPKKRLPKWLTYAILAVIVAGVGYLVWLYFNQPADNIQQVVQTKIEEKQKELLPVVFTDGVFKSLNPETNEIITLDEISDGEFPVEARTEDGKSVLYYASYSDPNSVHNGADKLYKKIAGEDATELLDFTTTKYGADDIHISHDGTKVSYELYSYDPTDQNSESYSVRIFDISSKETTTIVANNLDRGSEGPLAPIGWNAEDTSVILQQHTCYNCDGPVKSSVWEYNLKTKQLTKAYSLNQSGDESINDGEIHVDPNGNNVLVTNANDRGCCGIDLETAEKTRYQASLFNTKTAKATTVIPLTDQSIETVKAYGSNALNSGWSTDGGLVAFNIQEYKTTGTGDEQTTEAKFKEIQIYSLATKETESVTLSITGVTDATDSYISNLLPYDGGVILYAQQFSGNGETNVKVYNFDKSEKKVTNIPVGYTFGENEQFHSFVGSIEVEAN